MESRFKTMLLPPEVSGTHFYMGDLIFALAVVRRGLITPSGRPQGSAETPLIQLIELPLNSTHVMRRDSQRSPIR